MSTKDPRIDAYIENSADFAKPILRRLRQLIHQACSEVEETMKWSFPHFLYEGMLCSMAAFKQHCSFGFWKGALILPKSKAAAEAEEKGMGQFGRITSISGLPPDKVLLAYIKEAVRLNEQGIKLPARSRPQKNQALVIPADLVSALKRNKKASATFENFSYSQKKEYVQWITEAKREETRKKRIETTIEWLAHGKARNWKYEKC